MKSLWNDREATSYQDDPVAMRAYTSRLLGKNPGLVLHGGGNTSVKVTITNFYGEKEKVLYVKGSGWDLATILPAGFAPVRMDVLLKLASFEKLSDSDMVREQKVAVLNPDAPSPSVEAILHALIPCQYVDHTHSDAVVTLSNIPGGVEKLKKIYGNRVLTVPYVMPGHILARKIYEMTQDIDWSHLDGMILIGHGVFTFDDDPKKSYEKMIAIVTRAEEYFDSCEKKESVPPKPALSDPLAFARSRGLISKKAGKPMVGTLNQSPKAVAFSGQNQMIEAIAGPLTPDHIIHTKRVPLYLKDQDIASAVEQYAENYARYFQRHTNGQLAMLDPAPRWVIWPGYGIASFGASLKHAKVIFDINEHTIQAYELASRCGGFQALSEKDLFEVEYWELEQAKLKKRALVLPFQGKVAVVTGAASGIGKACVEVLVAKGACVAALDIDPKITGMFSKNEVLGLVCDITDTAAIQKALAKAVQTFGGIDILVSNAGTFPKSTAISELDDATWKKVIDVNLTGHQKVLRETIPYLKEGLGPSVVIIASKNVPAPGPGASAYSTAKAGLTQLGRVAALELAEFGIRVNMLHPNSVFDTGIWSEEVLKSRAQSYGLTVEEYKRRNLLKTEVSSRDVAEAVCAFSGPLFSKTTGAQLSIDGGDTRVI